MRVGTVAAGATLCLLMAVGTWLIGWPVVPAVALVWGLFSRPLGPWLAGFAGSVAWGILLAGAPWDALRRLAPRSGGIFGLPGWGIVALTLGYAWLLAWSAARVGAGVGMGLTRASTSPPTPRAPAGTG